MVLTLDVGNTNIVIGGFLNDKLTFVSRIATDTKKTEDEYAVVFKNIAELHNVTEAEVSGAIISSVVPPLTNTLKLALSTVFGVSAQVVGPGVKTGINIKCDNPASVGADLICACVAAHYIYGSPSLIVDMGTATKMMVVDETGTFIGASIIPGVNIGLKALASGTAQLPQISLEAPKSVLGKNTIDCMRSGVVYGNACMIDGMIDRFYDEVGEKLQVIATGGLAESIVPYCKAEIRLDKDLLLKGLYIIYNKNH